MTSNGSFDVKLTVRETGQAFFSLPVQIGRALRERGYNRASISVTADGILVRPYVAGDGPSRREPVELPEWS